MTYNKYPSGSEWAKWDLHVHTPMSIVQHYGGNQDEVWEKYVTDLENLPKEIKVIGVNDYLFIDGYEKLLNFKEKGRLQNIELLLPVIEIRIAQLVGSAETKKINFHIIFSNEIAPKSIKEYFLQNLKVKFHFWDNGAIHNEGKLLEFGQSYRKSLTESSTLATNNKTDKELGFENLQFELSGQESSVLKLLENLNFHKNGQPLFFTALGYSEWDSMRWDSAGSLKKDIITKTNFVLTATPSIEQFEKNKTKLIEQVDKNNIIHCSDAHDFSDKHHAESNTNKRHRGLGETFTWIKANPTFEGLRQIVFEPERVRIQESNPNNKELYHIIKSVRFIDRADRFIGNSIYLNSGLNAIIGGKSTGKSLLLHFIAKTLLFDTKNIQEKGLDKKYLKKDDKNKECFFEDFYDFDFEVEFADGKKFTLKDRKYYTDNNGEKQLISNNTLIEFIPQQWLSDMVDKHHKNEADSPYQRLIEKSLSEKQGYEEVKKEHEEKCNQLKKQVENKLNELFDIQKIIKDLDIVRAEMGNKQDFENSIQSLKKEISILKINSTLLAEEQQQFENLQEQKNNFSQKIKLCKNNIEALKNYKEKLQEDWQRFMNEVNENYKTVVQNFALSDGNFLDPIKKSLLDDLNSNYQNNIKNIKLIEDEFSTEKIDWESKKIQVETELKPLEEKYSNFTKIETLEKSILDYKQKIEKIQNKENIIFTKKENFETCKQSIKDIFKNLFEIYQNHIEYLNKKYSSIYKSDNDNKDLIELRSELGFDYNSFENNFLGNFHKSSQKNKQINSGNMFFDENNKIIKENYVNYTNHILDILLSENEGDLLFLSNKTSKMAIKSLFENRFQIDYKIKYENDWIEDMSQGKKGIVLLKLYLAIEKVHYPILIDQPEDNLDNRTIYTSLIDFIKKRKIDRQIIMVTHNANLVIATDAEQIIVAHQEVLSTTDEKTQEKNFKFEYVTGALEHTIPKNEKETGILYQQGIREHVCEILEGGEVAFKKREEKYGLK